MIKLVCHVVKKHGEMNVFNEQFYFHKRHNVRTPPREKNKKKVLISIDVKCLNNQNKEK